MTGRLKATIAVAVVLALILAATSALAITRTNQVRAAQAEQDRLEEQLSAAREEIASLRSDGETDNAVPDGLEGLEDLFGEGGGLGELFGDGDLGQLGDLFGELFGGDSGLGGGPDMSDMSDMAAIAACVQGAADRVAIDDSNGQEQFDDIEAAVADLRALEYTDPVEPTYLTGDEVTDRITEEIESEYDAEEADIDERYLAAVGAIEPSMDLLQTQKDLLGDQVAGFYDNDTGEMVVGTENPDAALNPTDQIALAHELTHAVTDQRLGLPELLDEDLPDSDAALAALALVEGDATLLMQRYAIAALDMGEQLGLAIDPRAAEAQQSLSAFPHVLQRQLTFPYEQGLIFACSLESDGGWAAVDAAYNDLPTSSAEILFPDRYGEERAAAPAALSAPGNDWDEALTDTMGAAELMWLFEAPGDDTSAALSSPMERVANWDGGTATMWTRGDDTALGVNLRDRGGDGPSLCESVTDWYDAAFSDDSDAGDEDAGDEDAGTQGDESLAVAGPQQAAVVSCTDDAVRLAIAPDLDSARAMILR